MNINLTMGHFASIVSLVFVATMFFKGEQLIRMIAWICLWQILTPVREFWEDILMLNFGFWIIEWFYSRLRRKENE